MYLYHNLFTVQNIKEYIITKPYHAYIVFIRAGVFSSSQFRNCFGIVKPLRQLYVYYCNVTTRVSCKEKLLTQTRRVKIDTVK